MSRSGNVNIVQTSSSTNGVPVCYIPNPYSSNDSGEFEGMAAVVLAMEHLNTGDGSIILELSGINQWCDLKFTTKAFDTEGSQLAGVNHVISMSDRSNTDQLLPAAIIGASRSSVSILITGLRGFPQISSISTSSALDDKSQYKLFGRTSKL